MRDSQTLIDRLLIDSFYILWYFAWLKIASSKYVQMSVEGFRSQDNPEGV